MEYGGRKRTQRMRLEIEGWSLVGEREHRDTPREVKKSRFGILLSSSSSNSSSFFSRPSVIVSYLLTLVYM